MKRISNLYSKIYSMENLSIAEVKSQKSKGNTYGVKLYKINRDENILQLYEMLKNKTFKTSNYTVFTVYEPKERIVYRLPYFPDRITHHAIMNVLEPYFVSVFTADTYSCIKGRGIHSLANKLKPTLRKNPIETKYCLKLDIKKFYPSIDHNILKKLLARKFKDQELLWLLNEIIDSADGLPIGNYLSQYLSNFYLTYFDHWIKEKKEVTHYFRYADDMIILHHDKAYLHQLLNEIRNYLKVELKLEVKHNYQIFPVASRGIDFVGYVFYHTHTMLRKRIKKNFAKMVNKNPTKSSISSYMGWAKHCNSKNLIKTLLKDVKI